ncbi:MAG: DNA repair protein RecO [Candidatus Calescibacterium sp.]
MFSKERALVITKKNKGEDLYICLLGEESGIFWCVAKHARKSRRRFLNILEPPSLIQAYLRKSKFSQNIIIEKAELENLFEEIKNSLLKILIAWFSLELTRAVSFSKDTFEVLLNFLLKISREDEYDLKKEYEKIIYKFGQEVLEKEGFIVSGKNGSQNSANLKFIEKTLEEIYGRKLKLFSILDLIKKVATEDDEIK